MDNKYFSLLCAELEWLGVADVCFDEKHYDLL